MSMLNFLFKDKDDKAPNLTLAPKPDATATLPPPGAPARAEASVAVAVPPPPNFDAIRSALDQIAEVLGRGEGYEMLRMSSADVNAIDLPLREVMRLCPSVFAQPQVLPADEKKKVSVLVEDVFNQLGHGRIVTSVKNLIADVPPEYLKAVVDGVIDGHVDLPLALVVCSINAEELRKRTTRRPRETGLEDMPNLFTPASLAKAAEEEAVEPEPEAPPATTRLTPEPAFVPEASPPEAESVSVTDEPVAAIIETTAPAGAETTGAAADTVDAGVSDMVIRGLDLNKAAAIELCSRLDGVGLRLAERIVRYRQENGPFMDLLDLSRVPGLGRRTFEKITGLPLPEGEEASPELLREILAPAGSGYLSVRDIVARFGALPGYEGCIIAHQDGYVLAACWADAAQEALGAFAPQIFKKIARYVQQLKIGEMSCLTVMVENRPITFVKSEDIYFVAVHKAGGLSLRMIRLVQGVGCRLGRLLRSNRLVA